MIFKNQDAWRNNPAFKPKNILPGFRTAVIIYGAYVAAEFFYENMNKPQKKATS
jgi:epoxyqueuosine reductase QueG